MIRSIRTLGFALAGFLLDFLECLLLSLLEFFGYRFPLRLEFLALEGRRYSRLGIRDDLLDIDPQGGVQLMETYPEAVTIFMAPPSMAELESRLRGRGTEDEDQVATRLGVAREEIGYAPRYDYLVVNDAVDEAVASIAAILTTERNRTSRNASFIRELRAQGESS